jgi:hypothetical protein
VRRHPGTVRDRLSSLSKLQWGETMAILSGGVAPGASERLDLQRLLGAKVEQLEQVRERFLKSTLHVAGAIVGAFALLSVLLIMVGETPSGPGAAFLVVTGIGVAIAVFYALARQRRWYGMTAEFLAPEICATLGDVTHDRARAEHFPVDDFEVAGIFNSAKGRTLDHSLVGSYRGVRYELAAAALRPRKGGSSKNNQTIFRGVLLKFELPARIPCRVLIQPAHSVAAQVATLFGQKAPRGLEPVATGDAAFDARFRMFADDVAAAMRTIDSHFRAALVSLAEREAAQGGQQLHLAIHSDAMLIALARQSDFLALASLFSPPADVDAMLTTLREQFATAQRVIHLLRVRGGPLG